MSLTSLPVLKTFGIMLKQKFHIIQGRTMLQHRFSLKYLSPRFSNCCFLLDKTASKDCNIKDVLYTKTEPREQVRNMIPEEKSSTLTKLIGSGKKLKGKMDSVVERENIWTIPNLLCITRIAVSPFLGYLIMQSKFEGAICVLIYAGITDLLDGIIARNFIGQASKLGSFLDPMADKILMATMFLSLTYVELMPVLLTTVIIVRDVSLMGAGFYIRYKSLPEPRTVSLYFDAAYASAQLSPTFISKLNTVVQISTAGLTLLSPLIGYQDHKLLLLLWWTTGVTTVVSGLSYVISKNTYKLFKSNKT